MAYNVHWLASSHIFILTSIWAKIILTGRLCIICGRRSCCHLVGIQPPGLYYPQKNLANQASTGPAPDIQKNLAKEQYDSHPKVGILE